MTAPLTPAEILAMLPQQEPFRFVDEILQVDDDGIKASYRFRPEADFYRGHFPGNPVTPGVILVEAMAQVGVVALGIHLLSKELLAREQADQQILSRAGLMAEIGRVVTMFSDMTAEFTGVVKPGDRVLITGRKVFFRRLKLRSSVAMLREDGTQACSGTVSGMGVRQ